MLRGIHKASSGWLGKAVMMVVMGLLVVSFAIWGIGDIFRGFGLSSAAKIGSTEISIEQFRRYYSDRLGQLSRRLGRPISADQAKALGIDRQLLGQLVAETTLDERARDMKLAISDAEISRRITADPSFQGIAGGFDRNRFLQMIRDAGFVESTYLAEQRRLTVRRQIAMSVSGEIKAPVTALRMIDRFQNEKRSAELIVLGAAQAGDVAKPDETTLKKYFDDHKIQFRAPETRKVVLLALTPADQARWNTVPDADVKTYYEQHKAEYATPERRQLRQMVFASAEEAKAASERIGKGASFNDIAKERGVSDSDTDLGTVTKANVIDPRVADAAFALKEGEVSAPVQGNFGTVLVQALKIEPGTQKTFEEVAPQINKTIAEQRARNEIGNLRDKIEDERAGGATLAETAKKLGLTAQTIEAIDRSGRGPDGTPVAGLPQGADVITAAFSSDVGVDTDPLQLPGGGYVWYDVAGVNASHERNLDEIKDQVETRWRDDEIAMRLGKKADELLGKLKAGGTMAQAASDAGVKVESAAGLQRGQPTPVVSGKVLDGIFRTAKGAPGSAEGGKPTERVVFTVTDIADPALDLASEEAKKLQETLNSSYVDDLLGEYVAKLENEIGVNINQQAVAQVTGTSSN